MFRHRHPRLTLAGRPREGRKVETTSQPPVKLPSWPRARTVRGARAILQTFIIFPLMGAFSPLTVIDRYRVNAIKGGAIFVSNHSSALDAVVMLQALPSRFRFRAFVVAAADSIFKRKWEAMLTELLINTFPIPRAGGARQPGGAEGIASRLCAAWRVGRTLELLVLSTKKPLANSHGLLTPVSEERVAMDCYGGARR